MDKEIVVEKLSSTAITDDMQDEWLECVNILDKVIDDEYAENSGDDPTYVSEILEELETIKNFVEEFRFESERVIAVNAFDIEPRSCGSCHMLARNFVENKYNPENLKCVYENGPEFQFGDVDKWFKLCEYYIQRAD